MSTSLGGIDLVKRIVPHSGTKPTIDRNFKAIIDCLGSINAAPGLTGPDPPAATIVNIFVDNIFVENIFNKDTTDPYTRVRWGKATGDSTDPGGDPPVCGTVIVNPCDDCDGLNPDTGTQLTLDIPMRGQNDGADPKHFHEVFLDDVVAFAETNDSVEGDRKYTIVTDHSIDLLQWAECNGPATAGPGDCEVVEVDLCLDCDGLTPDTSAISVTIPDRIGYKSGLSTGDVIGIQRTVDHTLGAAKWVCVTPCHTLDHFARILRFTVGATELRAQDDHIPDAEVANGEFWDGKDPRTAGEVRVENLAISTAFPNDFLFSGVSGHAGLAVFQAAGTPNVYRIIMMECP